MKLARLTSLLLLASCAVATSATAQNYYALPFNDPPTASFFANPPRVFVGKTVHLDGRASSDPEGRPLSFAWDLDGNGSHETPTGADPQILTAFCAPAVHTVGLKVTDPGGDGDSTRKSAGTTRTVDAVQASPQNSCDISSPNVRLSGISRSLRRAIRRGLAVRLRCSEACTMTASVGVNRRTGRRFGLKGRRRTLGRASGAVIKPGSRRLTLKFSRTARRKLRKARRVSVTLRFSIRDAAGNRRGLRRTITLRR